VPFAVSQRDENPEDEVLERKERDRVFHHPR
jgi:hypothetical protein